MRKNRSELEAKRRAAGLGPSPKGMPLQQLLLADLQGSPAHSTGGSELEATAHSTDSPVARASEFIASASRRPQRKAAARAAERTAEFANTGDWPQDDARPAKRAKQTNSDSSAASMQNSDAAEEVAWAPAHLCSAPGPIPQGLLPEATSAAVDLLTMTAKLPEPAVSTPSTPAKAEVPSPGHIKTEVTAQAVASTSAVRPAYVSCSTLPPSELWSCTSMDCIDRNRCCRAWK